MHRGGKILLAVDGVALGHAEAGEEVVMLVFKIEADRFEVQRIGLAHDARHQGQGFDPAYELSVELEIGGDLHLLAVADQGGLLRLRQG